MATANEHAIFRSIGGDGSIWLFSVVASDEWVITRNGERIDDGTGKRTSIERGIERFLLLTSEVPGGDAMNRDRQAPGPGLSEHERSVMWD